MFNRKKNYILIKSTDHLAVRNELQHRGITKAHFTNGTYAHGPGITLATTLAGFKHALNVDATLPLILAVNSDESMRALGKVDFGDQYQRADIVATALAETFPQNRVMVIFYDEKTPIELYQCLSKKEITFSLHKWAFGTDPNGPVVEGAESFENVFAHPLPDDSKPLCWNETRKGVQENVKLVELKNTLITPDRKCIFDLPEAYSHYQQSNENVKLNQI